jgi:hypothetical protein
MLSASLSFIGYAILSQSPDVRFRQTSALSAGKIFVMNQ